MAQSPPKIKWVKRSYLVAHFLSGVQSLDYEATGGDFGDEGPLGIVLDLIAPSVLGVTSSAEADSLHRQQTLSTEGDFAAVTAEQTRFAVVAE
jgi:hypothetical protein